jgi:diguanylate cyclase (GGDEF)-like protein
MPNDQINGPPVASVHPAEIRLLVVEDDPAIRQAQADALQTAGFQVETAADGVVAVQKIGADPYDAVITDLRLPGQDGRAVLRAAKQVDERTAVIVTSAYGTIETAVELMREGADDFLPKPVTRDRLLLAVQRALRLKRLEDLARTTQHFERLSLTDDLTGLCNRRAFDDALAKEVSRSRRYQHPLSLLVVDLDHFKQVNDSYGHPTGDNVLRETARLLSGGIRQHDTVARLGGDEFVLLAPVTDQAGLRSLGQRLVASVRNHVFRHPQTDLAVHLTASAGGATFPLHTREASDLVQIADRQLYRAKEAGRDRLCLPDQE